MEQKKYTTKHRELFESFAEEFEKSRKNYAKLASRPRKSNYDPDVEQKINLFDDQQMVKEMNDMVYLYSCIVKHYGEAIRFLSVFIHEMGRLKMNKYSKLTYPAGYEKMMDDIKKHHEENGKLAFLWNNEPEF